MENMKDAGKNKCQRANSIGAREGMRSERGQSDVTGRGKERSVTHLRELRECVRYRRGPPWAVVRWDACCLGVRRGGKMDVEGKASSAQTESSVSGQSPFFPFSSPDLARVS
jgi:hypothetical protein